MHFLLILTAKQIIRRAANVEKCYEEFKNLDPTMVPELKLEQAVTAIRTGITNATGPIALAATLYKTPITCSVCHRLRP